MRQALSALFAAALATAVVAEEKPLGRNVELICTEYSPVVYKLRRGAPDRLLEADQQRRHPDWHFGWADAWGELNHRKGVWTHSGKEAMILCGYLFSISDPVTDIVPDAPQAGAELECKVLVKSDRAGEGLIDEYEFTWHRIQDGKWIKADVPVGSKVAKGVTKKGERWTCYVVPRGAPPEYTGAARRDEVEIGASRPGDSRAHCEYGWAYGQWRHVRGYLKFDISSLTGKQLKAVKLRLFCEVQDPPFELQAYASSNSWKEQEITWVNQPLKFPFADKPIAAVKLEDGPEPTAENPANSENWGRAPAWRELDVTAHVRRAVSAGDKELSVCLACAAQTTKDHSRMRIFNDQIAPGHKKDRGDMRPRLTVDVE